MTVSDSNRSYSRNYLNVVCPCGKTLRAKVEAAGTEVRCWSCRQMVPVPLPNSPEKTRRAFRAGWDDVFLGPTFGVLLLAATALTGLLAVPRLGITLATAGMVAAMFGYGALIARGEVEPKREEADETNGEQKAPRVRARSNPLAARVGIALALGLGWSAPFWLAPGGLGQAPRLSWITLPLLSVVLVVLPLVASTVFARDRLGPFPLEHGIASLRRHKWAVVFALAIVPLAALTIEAFLLGASYHFRLLPFLLLDLFPKPESQLRLYRLPIEVSYSFGTLNEGPFVRMYRHRLAQGYTLLGAVPASLPVPKILEFNPWSGLMEDLPYFLVRFALTQVVMTGMLFALALQARWLGLIAALDSRLARVSGAESIEADANSAVTPSA